MEKLREIAQTFTDWDWACVAYTVGLGLLGIVRLRRWFREERPDEPAPSAPIDALLGLGLGLVAFGFVYPFVQSVLVQRLTSEQLFPSVSSHLLMGLVGQMVATALMVALWIALRPAVIWSPTAPANAPDATNHPLAALPGLHPRAIGTALVCVIGLGLAGGVAWKLLHTAWEFAAAHGFPFAAPADEPQDVVQLVLDVPVRSRTFLMLTLTVSVGAPIMEELAFRGMLYPGLRRLLAGASARHARWMAVCLTGAIFSAAHQSPSAALPLFGFGAFMCLVRDRYGLLTCMAAHACFNGWNLVWLKLAPNASTL